jgi:hypothetical protein
MKNRKNRLDKVQRKIRKVGNRNREATEIR